MTMTKQELALECKRAMLTAGIPYQDITTVLDLADHACNESSKLWMRIADSAPDNLQIQAMLTILAFMNIHVDVVSRASDQFMRDHTKKQEL